MTIEDVKKRLEKLGLEIDHESGKILVEWEKIPFQESDRSYWAALSSIDGVGPSTLPMLVAGFGSARNVLSLAAGELQGLGLSEKISQRIERMGKKDIQRWYETCTHSIVDEVRSLLFIVPSDREFPQSLRKFEHGPSQLWVWGDPKILSHDRIVAVVGTRKMTPYGKDVSTMLASKLGAFGCVVVSGLMYGVDETAMRGAMSGGGKTIGVWAGGLTRSSLGSRFRLAGDVVKNGGVVISEFSPDHAPLKGMFPARNRIVSGLSRGVVVTEGAVKSGSLITASQAMEQGKPVGAVPGPITSNTSAGPNELLKMGSTVVTSADEILAMCGISQDIRTNARLDFIPKNDIQSSILSVLLEHSLTIDEVVRQTHQSISVVSEHLTDLELLGIVKQDGEIWKLA